VGGFTVMHREDLEKVKGIRLRVQGIGFTV
jgi:hypothetical protein